MENPFIPEYLLHGSEDEFDQKIAAISDTYFMNQVKANEKTECEMLDLMIENVKQCTAEMIHLQMESNKVQEHKKNLMKELTELELTVKDCQEEIEMEKTELENLEVQIQKKSDVSIKLNQEIKSEETRIETVKRHIKSEYNYYKQCNKQYSTLFNCDLKLDRESNIYRLVLKDDEQKERVTIDIRTEDEFPSKKNFKLLDIQMKSGIMDPELKKHIQEMMNESQDTQGLLAFLHKNCVRK